MSPMLLLSWTKYLTPLVLHSTVIKNGTSHTLQVVNYLLTLYFKASELHQARQLFDEILERDVRTWTILISGLSRCGYHKVALDYFSKMQIDGWTVTPNAFTLSAVLKSCASISSDGLRMGKAVHGWMVMNGIDADVALNNSVLDLYSKFRAFDYVNRFFDLMDDKDSISWNIMMAAYICKGDMVQSLDLFWRIPMKSVSSWNTMIDGFLQHGFDSKGLELLYRMVEVGPAFNGVTYSISSVLAASLKNLKLGRQVHGRLLRIGMSDDSFAITSLLDMYCKCGKMDRALLIFQEIQLRCPKGFYNDSMAQTISWSTMIAGYVQNGMIEDALVYLKLMINAQVEVDPFTLTTIITASANAVLLDLGEEIHARVLKLGHGQDVFLCSSMIDMYAKCGKLDDAWLYFRQTRNRNVVLWSVMISSYATHGWGKEAIGLFEMMRSEGIRPNKVTFVGLLNACSHAGLIEDGCKYFEMMMGLYGIQPEIEHFACMVDLFGRAGHLDEIKDFVYENRIRHVKEVWKAYLSCCWLHKNVKMIKWVSNELLKLEPQKVDSHLLMSNTYSANHAWEEATKVRNLIPGTEARKLPGQSWIQV